MLLYHLAKYISRIPSKLNPRKSSRALRYYSCNATLIQARNRPLLNRHSLQITQHRNHVRIPKMPELIYVPKVMRWVVNKIRLKVLQKSWDPEFTEGSFIYGSTKALCKITEIIHDDDVGALNGLVTNSAKIKLIDGMAKLTKQQKKIIVIVPADIKILIPTFVNLENKNNVKNCRIGMRVMALKWFRQSSGGYDLVLVVLQAEFFRDYRQGSLPEWTISGFDVVECSTLSKAQVT